MNQKNRHTISIWETATKSRPEIEIEQFNLNDGYVSSAIGYVVYSGKRKRVTWRYDGRCYYRGRRVVTMDIRL